MNGRALTRPPATAKGGEGMAGTKKVVGVRTIDIAWSDYWECELECGHIIRRKRRGWNERYEKPAPKRAKCPECEKMTASA